MIIILNLLDKCMKLEANPWRGYSDFFGVQMFGWKFWQPPDSQIAKEPNL